MKRTDSSFRRFIQDIYTPEYCPQIAMINKLIEEEPESHQNRYRRRELNYYASEFGEKKKMLPSTLN